MNIEIDEGLSFCFPAFRQRCIEWANANWQKDTHRVILGSFYTRSPELAVDINVWEQAVADYPFLLNDLSKDEDNLLLPRLFGCREVWDTSAYHQVLQWNNTMEFDCQRYYFSIAQNSAVLCQLCEYDFYAQGKIVFDKWWAFVKRILAYRFNDFELNLDGGKGNRIHLRKEIAPNIYLALECQLTDIMWDLKENCPDLPDLKIFVYSGDQKTIRGSVRRSEKRYLGLLGNPLFYHPCYPLRGYLAVLRVEKKNGVISFRKPDEFIPQIAERAYFYVSMLQETSDLFLKYLQDGILKNYRPG